MRKQLLFLALVLVMCLGLTATAFAAGDPADVSDPNCFSGSTTFCMVIDGNHTLWTKGINSSGQMGLGVIAETTVISDSFSKVMDGVASVCTFQERSVAAVKSDGSLWTWGSNVGGWLGHTDGVETEWFGTVQPSPKKIMDNVAAASIGKSGVVAIKTEGSLWLLAKEHKKIADSNVIYAVTMEKEIGYITTDHTFWIWSPESVRTVGGDAAIFALKTDNTLWAKGNNYFYQFGNGTRQDSEKWLKIMDNVASFSADDEMVGAVKTDGTLWHWGQTYRVSDTRVKEGLQEFACQSVPIQVSSNVKKAVGGDYYTIKPDGTIHSWRYEKKNMNMVQRGFSDIKLTDIATPVSAPSGTVPGTAGRFEDVRTTDYFYEAVNWAVEKDITGGKSETRFAPYDKCTIGEAMIFLWRAAGQPEPTVSPDYRWGGLEEDDYRYKPYNWSLSTVYPFALHNFGSSGAGCSRLLIVNMLWYLIGRPEPACAQGQFTDVNWNDSLTAKAVAWAVERGIASGTGDGTFSPNEQCTRAQIVTFLYRALA